MREVLFLLHFSQEKTKAQRDLNNMPKVKQLGETGLG